MDAKPDTVAGDQLDILTTLVEAWEQKHHPIDAPDPIAAIRFAMEQRGLTRRDLEPLIGFQPSHCLAFRAPIPLRKARRLPPRVLHGADRGM